MISIEEKRAQWRKASLKRNQNPDRKEYLKKYQLELKRTNPQKVKEHNQAQGKRMLRVKKEHKTALGGKCSICGYDKCLAALHLHHVLNEKVETPGCELMRRNTVRGENVREFIKRTCILICANCHAEIHEKEGWTSRKVKQCSL